MLLLFAAKISNREQEMATPSISNQSESIIPFARDSGTLRLTNSLPNIRLNQDANNDDSSVDRANAHLPSPNLQLPSIAIPGVPSVPFQGDLTQFVAVAIQGVLQAQSQSFASTIGDLVSKMNPFHSYLFKLPQFSPDHSNFDVRSWINKIDVLMHENPRSGSELYSLLSTASKGSSAAWLSQILTPGMTWPHLREQFVMQYCLTETPVTVLFDILHRHPQKMKT